MFGQRVNKREKIQNGGDSRNADDVQAAVQAWRGKRQPSSTLLRMELACDLTIVQGASLAGWSAFAWVVGLQAPDFHNVALYGGVFCIQYLALAILWYGHRFLDDWNNVQLQPIVLNATKNLIDVTVNVLLRMTLWGTVVALVIFSAFNLRVVLLHSVTNFVISFCALANFVVLMHLARSILEKCQAYVDSLSRTKPGEKGPGFISRITLYWWVLIIKGIMWLCQGSQILLHLWPLADSMLLCALVALISYLSGRSIDSAWMEPEQLKHAQRVARDSRQLIWPTVILMFMFIYDVTRSILKLSHEYALRFLVGMSNIGTEEVGGDSSTLSNEQLNGRLAPKKKGMLEVPEQTTPNVDSTSSD